MRLCVAFAACVLLSSSLVARADSFTESVTFGPGPTDFNNSTGTTAGPNGNQLYLFDSNGGTLNFITVSYGYSFQSNITVTNTSNGASIGSVRTESGAQFGSNNSAVTQALNSAVNTAGSVSFGSTTLNPAAYDLLGSASNYNLAPGGSITFNSSNSISKTVTITDATLLAAFSNAGGGSFTPLFSTLTGLDVTNSGGNTIATQNTVANGQLVLSYNYTLGAPPAPVSAATPEPSSLMLLGTGVVGVLGAARRRFFVR